jgi:hypothetical protein
MTWERYVDEVLMTSVVSCSAMRLLRAAYTRSSNPLSADDRWISLFDEKNSDGRHACLDSSGKNNHPHRVFKLDSGRIHSLDVPMSDGKSENGYLATDREFSDVHVVIGPSLPRYDDDRMAGQTISSLPGRSSRILNAGDFVRPRHREHRGSDSSQESNPLA